MQILNVRKLVLMVGVLAIFNLTEGMCQVTIYNSSKEIAQGEQFTKEQLKELKVKIPIEQLKKYDKVVFKTEYDLSEVSKWVQASAATFLPCEFYYLPNTREFMDEFENKEALDFYLVKQKKNNNDGMCIESYLDVKNIKFKIVVEGYFEDGTEAYWSESSNSARTRQLYKFSKRIAESVDCQYIKPKKK
ncbi:MAG: hypothetical protein MRY83_07425 [Flavobacteriales bacterium]|nr:hypothetical protein [Flavobacteriales bacterium]